MKPNEVYTSLTYLQISTEVLPGFQGVQIEDGFTVVQTVFLQTVTDALTKSLKGQAKGQKSCTNITHTVDLDVTCI